MSEIAIPEGQLTLVKYNSPESVTTLTLKELSKKPGGTVAIYDGVPFPSCEEILVEKMTAEEILNEILPPHEWETNGKKWHQSVSTVPATRGDVISLQELLDRRLKERKARELGICHIRRELYTEFFDELIRQVTIESSERGLLLYRIKREFNQTIREYESIYKSAVGYGIRNRMTAETDKQELDKNLYEYPLEIEELKASIANLKIQIDNAQLEGFNRREELLETRENEIAQMKAANETVKSQIWTVLFPRNIGV